MVGRQPGCCLAGPEQGPVLGALGPLPAVPSWLLRPGGRRVGRGGPGGEKPAPYADSRRLSKSRWTNQQCGRLARTGALPKVARQVPGGSAGGACAGVTEVTKTWYGRRTQER